MVLIELLFGLFCSATEALSLCGLSAVVLPYVRNGLFGMAGGRGVSLEREK